MYYIRCNIVFAGHIVDISFYHSRHRQCCSRFVILGIGLTCIRVQVYCLSFPIAIKKKERGMNTDARRAIV